MFQKKRKLKKERNKTRVRILGFVLVFIFFIGLAVEYAYVNFSVGKKFVSPIAKNTSSKTQDLEKELEKKNINFTSTNLSNDGSLTINLLGGGVVNLSSKKDIGSQLSSLQLILSRLTIEGKKLKSLDLKFDSPVISF